MCPARQEKIASFGAAKADVGSMQPGVLSIFPALENEAKMSL